MRKSTKRQHWALINPIEHAAHQASTLSTAEWNAQLTPVIAALEQVQRGEWDARENWNPLFYCLNRIESMLHIKKASDHGLIADCQRAFVDALDRRNATGATSLKAGELAALKEMVSVYGDLLKEISRGDFQRACNHTDANVNRIAHSKNTTGRTLRVGGAVIEMEKRS